MAAPLPAHRARKRFGQHFLTDPAILEQMLEGIAPRSGQRIVEIGPGLGALTDGLIEQAGRIAAIELDRDLAQRLRKRHGPDRLELSEGDVLAFDWAPLVAAGRVRVVGNLPYNISTPLLVRLIDWRDHVVDQHFMLQKEVVERIVASEGKDYGRLGVLLQAFYDCIQLFDVPPQAFTPPPKVQSAVVRMRPREPSAAIDPPVLSQLLAAAFGRRRKMLRGTLLPWLEARGLEAPEIDGQARAEEIPATVWHALAARLTTLSTNRGTAG